MYQLCATSAECTGGATCGASPIPGYMVCGTAEGGAPAEGGTKEEGGASSSSGGDSGSDSAAATDAPTGG